MSQTAHTLRATFRLATPPPGGAGAGAIAAIELTGDIDGVLNALRIKPVAIGAASLRDLGGIDRGVVARWSATHATLMPHAGPAVLSQLLASLRGAGLAPAESSDPRASYPQAADLIEARVMAALARAESELAIDLLLDQPRRWRAALCASSSESDSELPGRSRRLRRLIDAPLVAAIGPPNIGKSTLLNALAGRAVSIVADEPGTTRDHVGIALNLAGLVVHYLDLPGITRAPGKSPTAEIDAAAQSLALKAAARADLILLCADASAPFLANPFSAVPTLRVALRADLGPTADRRPHDLKVSATRGEGLDTLVAAIREALVPQRDLDHPGPWMFWNPTDPAPGVA